MTNIRSKIKSYPVIYFLIKVGIICIILQLIYDFVFLPSGHLDLFLCKSGASIAAWNLNFLGWSTDCWGTILAVKGYGAVEIITDCNGLTLMGLYASFILAYNGPLKLKMIFIIAGILLLYISNTLRIMGFALANVYFPDHWDTFHEFSAFIFLYPVMLSLWYLWTLKSDQDDILSPSRFSLV